jgi:predicted nucleic acid-binding protein
LAHRNFKWFVDGRSEKTHRSRTASDPLKPVEAKVVLALSEKHGLTVYDAAYLELACRKQLPLGTLDGDLRRAGLAENIVLL